MAIYKKGQAPLLDAGTGKRCGTVRYETAQDTVTFRATGLSGTATSAYAFAADTARPLKLRVTEADRQLTCVQGHENAWSSLWLVQGERPLAYCCFCATDREIVLARLTDALTRKPQQRKQATPEAPADTATLCSRPALYKQGVLRYDDITRHYGFAAPGILPAQRECDLSFGDQIIVRAEITLHDTPVTVLAYSAGNPALRPSALPYNLRANDGTPLWCAYIFPGK